MPLLVGDVAQAVLETGDLAEPLHLVGFAEPFPGVDLDCCRALILQTITSFIVPTGDVGVLSSS